MVRTSLQCSPGRAVMCKCATHYAGKDRFSIGYLVGSVEGAPKYGGLGAEDR